MLSRWQFPIKSTVNYFPPRGFPGSLNSEGVSLKELDIAERLIFSLYFLNLLYGEEFSLYIYMLFLLCAYLTHIKDSTFHWFL